MKISKLFAGMSALALAGAMSITAFADAPINGYDETKVIDDGNVGGSGVYWLGGEMGTNNVSEWSGNLTGFDMSSERNDNEGWVNQWAYAEIVGRPGINAGTNKSFGFEGNERNYIFFQTWAATQHQLIDFYIADLQFTDEDGIVIMVPEENIPGGASYESQSPTGE